MNNSLQHVKRGLATAVAFSMYHASTAFAQGAFDGTPGVTGLPDATDAGGIRSIMVSIIETVLSFLAIIAVIVVIIAGIRLIVSQGEEEQKNKAKKTIIYALIGLAVVLFARVIVGIVTVWLAGEV